MLMMIMVTTTTTIIMYDFKKINLHAYNSFDF